jgi:putative transposase
MPCATLGAPVRALHRSARRRRRRPLRGQQGRQLRQRCSRVQLSPNRTELVHRRGPWKGLDDVELATLEYVDWCSHGRRHSACGDIPPVEFDHTYYRSITGLTEDLAAHRSLHWTQAGSTS